MLEAYSLIGCLGSPFFHVTGMVGHIGTCIASGTLSFYFTASIRKNIQMIEKWKAPVRSQPLPFYCTNEWPGYGKYDLSSFKKFTVAGPCDPAVWSDLKNWRDLYSHVYGLTESTSPERSSRWIEGTVDLRRSIALEFHPSHEAKIMDLSDPEKNSPWRGRGVAIKGPGIISDIGITWRNRSCIRQGWLFTGMWYNGW